MRNTVFPAIFKAAHYQMSYVRDFSPLATVSSVPGLIKVVFEKHFWACKKIRTIFKVYQSLSHKKDKL